MEDDVTELLPIPAAQAHLGCGGHGAPWPTSPGTALTLAPGFLQTPTRVEEGRVVVPSCVSCPGHRLKPGGMEVFFYYSFGQTRRAWQGQALGSPGKLSSPHPTPPPGGATRQREGNASQRGKWTPSGSAPAGAINSPIVQIYRAGWSTPPASQGPGCCALDPALPRAGGRVRLRPGQW